MGQYFGTDVGISISITVSAGLSGEQDIQHLGLIQFVKDG